MPIFVVKVKMEQKQAKSTSSYENPQIPAGKLLSSPPDNIITSGSLRKILIKLLKITIAIALCSAFFSSSNFSLFVVWFELADISARFRCFSLISCCNLRTVCISIKVLKIKTEAGFTLLSCKTQATQNLL